MHKSVANMNVYNTDYITKQKRFILIYYAAPALQDKNFVRVATERCCIEAARLSNLISTEIRRSIHEDEGSLK